jgi:hypothetical protein
LIIKGKNNDQTPKEILAKALMVDELPNKSPRKKINVLLYLFRIIN